MAVNENVVEIANGIYWVGGGGLEGNLRCNPYLLIDGDEAVLFDPGSVLDFSAVYANIRSLIDPAKIKYVVLHHQDPDLCSSVPLLEKAGLSFTIVTHWRSRMIIDYYGVDSSYYIVNEHDLRLELSSGRLIRFIQTPYLHFPGAIMSYDSFTKTMLTSDLFGAFPGEDNGLYAGPGYLESMKMFHEHYMPSNDILRPVMEVLLRMDIDILAPQHGRVIKENIKEHIIALRDLDCGSFLAPIRKDLAVSGGYASVYSKILQRYAALFGTREVEDAIEGLDIQLDQTNYNVVDYNYTGNLLWDEMFEHIQARKGINWIMVIEPLVRKITVEYDLPLPRTFEASLQKTKSELSKINAENERLAEINRSLNDGLEATRNQLIRCPETGLYNQEFFSSYLVNEFNLKDWRQNTANPGIIMLSVDNFGRIQQNYGYAEMNNALRTLTYILKEISPENSVIFKLNGAEFVCYLPDTTRDQAILLAEAQRSSIEKSAKFIEPLTVSVGLATANEFLTNDGEPSGGLDYLFEIAESRVQLAKKLGMNRVCHTSEQLAAKEIVAKILLADTDMMNIKALSSLLENERYQVFPVTNGVKAAEIAEKEDPDVVIAEVMLPQIDGFMLREKLQMYSHTKDALFILISNVKTEATVKRAQGLGIMHYFQKPFLLPELLGLVKYHIKGKRKNDR